MASEREDAKQAISARDQADPELDNAIGNAQQYQLQLDRENNRHKEAIHSAELGAFGRWIGGASSAPVAVALIALLICLLGALACYIAGYGQPSERSEEHTSELQSLMRNSYAVLCLKKTKKTHI